MLIIGMIMCAVSGAWLLVSVFDFDEPVEIVISVLILIIGIGMIVYDVNSPVEIVANETFYTNDYARYSLNIDSDEIGRVKTVATKPTRAFTVYNYEVTHTFVGFDDE